MKFHLITTGGTIDAEPYEVANTPTNITPLAESLVPEMLRYLKVDDFFHTHFLFLFFSGSQTFLYFLHVSFTGGI